MKAKINNKIVDIISINFEKQTVQYYSISTTITKKTAAFKDVEFCIPTGVTDINGEPIYINDLVTDEQEVYQVLWSNVDCCIILRNPKHIKPLLASMILRRV